MGISILAACQNDCSQNWTEAWSKPDEIQWIELHMMDTEIALARVGDLVCVFALNWIRTCFVGIMEALSLRNYFFLFWKDVVLEM
jgi:hypothetical protein